MTSVDVLTPPTFPVNTMIAAVPITPATPTFPVTVADHTVALIITATHIA